MIIQVFFFKFHDFSMHRTFFVIFHVFHDFQSLWEPCTKKKNYIKYIKIITVVEESTLSSCYKSQDFKFLTWVFTNQPFIKQKNIAVLANIILMKLRKVAMIRN